MLLARAPYARCGDDSSVRERFRPAPVPRAFGAREEGLADGCAPSGDMRKDARHTNVTVISYCNRTALTLFSLSSGLSPEIVHFRIESDGISDSSTPQDWYIKGAMWVPLRTWVDLTVLKLLI